MSALEEPEAERLSFARPALPLELQAHILKLALEDEKAITGNFKAYLFNMLCLSKALSPVVLRHLYRSVEIRNGRAKPVRTLIKALCTSAASSVKAIESLSLGTVSEHHISSPTPTRNNNITEIVRQCRPQELSLYVHFPRIPLVSAFHVSHLERLVICCNWDSGNAMPAFGDLLKMVAAQAPQATVSLSGAAVSSLAHLDPVLIADAGGLQHLTLLHCATCENEGFNWARTVYTMLFQRHGNRLRHLDIKGWQCRYPMANTVPPSTMGQFQNLETIVIWIDPNSSTWPDVLEDLANLSSLKRVVLEEYRDWDEDTIEDLLDICERILRRKRNLPILEQLNVKSFDLRASIEELDRDDDDRELMEWEISLERLEDVCSRRKIALVC